MTSYEARHGVPYRSPLAPFGELVMVRVPIDPPGLRRKLDSQWFKGRWVGRLEANDGNIVGTPHGTVIGRAVRRLHPDLRFDKDFCARCVAHPAEPTSSQAKLLRLMPLSLPTRMMGFDEMREEPKQEKKEELIKAKEVVIYDPSGAVSYTHLTLPTTPYV